MGFSLKTILSVSFLLPVIITATSVSSVSLWFSQKAIDNLAYQLMSQSSDRILDNVRRFLALPQEITQTSQNLVTANIFDLETENMDNWLPFLWEEYQTNKDKFIAAIQIVNLDNYYVASGQSFKTKTGEKIEGVAVSYQGKYRSYLSIENYQKNLNPIINFNYFSAQERPWYQAIINKKNKTWTKVYSRLSNKESLVINFSQPLYLKKSSEIQGVISVQLDLIYISQFLNSLNIGKTGKAMIINQNGDLIATSTHDNLSVLENNQAKLISITNHENNVKKAIGLYLLDRYQSFDKINQSLLEKVTINEEKYFLLVNNLKDEYGLDWLLIINIPEIDFLAEIQANYKQTIFLTIISIIITVILSLVIASIMAKPIAKLNVASQNIARGNWQKIPVNNPINELNNLSQSFNTMSQQLQDYNRTLELQVQQRTLELAEAKEKAEVANHAKSAFLANMSHELRSPLNIVLGFTRLMIKGDNLSSEIKENLGIIKSSGEHLLNLINNILDLSKIEAGKIYLNCQDFSLDNLLKDIEILFTLKAEEKNIIFKICRGNNLPHFINSDEIKLRQVLINLVDNAFKFTSQGMIIVTVHSSVNTIEDNDKISKKIELIFSIEDTGIGIPKEEIESIFKPFQQIENNQKDAEGTGLGLAISRQFIKLMGGDIHIHSQEKIGSKFTFNIIVKEVNNQIIKEETSYTNIIGLAKNQPNYKLLIVDDKPLNRQLLIKILQPLGFHLKEAENGKEAITIWQQWQPHLIWLDMKMPIMNGYDTVKYIKNHSQGKDAIEQCRPTVVIALTASALISERNLILNAGCDDFLAKPFLEIDIYRMLEKYLGVSYIYQEENMLTEVKLERKEKKLTPDDVQFMPLKWRKLMYENAVKLNEEEMLDLIAQIPEEKLEIKEKLIDMINNFDMDIIIKLFHFLK